MDELEAVEQQRTARERVVGADNGEGDIASSSVLCSLALGGEAWYGNETAPELQSHLLSRLLSPATASTPLGMGMHEVGS